ncbi:hypothetical protein ARMGADRAFT_927442 [Armillaria gallica]|uniref:Uncharacterized protein n=1 Tax=Armillaria gallica TaxID=47427 RepID=A0A2H3DTN7_ARMGA|nr:hypothetical protein ARMGADRAFT_927442 [Armillaria gallica]
MQLQSAFVLQELYCKKVRHQLAQKETRKRKGKSHQLGGDGMPQLLTGNEFYEPVVEYEANQVQEQMEKES